MIIIFSISTIPVVIILLLLMALRSGGPDLQMEAAGELGVEAGAGIVTPPPTPLPQEPPSLPAAEMAALFETLLNANGAGMPSAEPVDNMPGGEEPQEPWLGLEWQDAPDKGFVPGDGPPLVISGRLLDPWGNPAPNVHVDAYLVLADGSLQSYVPPAGTVNPYPCLSLFDNYCPPNPFSDADGYYSITVDNPGMYKLFFNGMVTLTTVQTQSWAWRDRVRWPAAEWYNNYQSLGDATEVPSGATGVDAILVPMGVLAGSVNSYNILFAPSPDATAPNPPAVSVAAYLADRDELVATANIYSRTSLYSNVIHSFYFDSLLPGEYKILATPDYTGWDTDYYGTKLMMPTWFGGTDSWDSARSVLVTGGPVSTIEIEMNEIGSGVAIAAASQAPQEPFSASSDNEVPGGSYTTANTAGDTTVDEVSEPEPLEPATSPAGISSSSQGCGQPTC